MAVNTEDKTDYKARIEYLKQFMTEERFGVLTDVLNQRTKYVTVCMENTFHPQNASAVVRSAEAFGIQDIHTIETLCAFSPNVRIVRGTDKWVDIKKYHTEQNPTTFLLRKLKADGYRIVATTPHKHDCTPETLDVEKGKFAIFFGTEHAGISDEVIENADEFLRIPMYGFVESLNISACAAITLHTVAERVRNSNIEWQLAEYEKDEIMYRWMQESIKDSKNILKRYDETH